MDRIISVCEQYAKPILIVVIGYITIKALGWILKASLKKTTIDNALHKFIINSTKCVIALVVFITFLDAIGVNTKSLVTVLGISGGAIAFALKDSLSNIAGGFIILLTNPFAKGDFVDINGTVGRVKQIDMILTTVVTSDNKIITIPNGMVSSGVITNYTRADIRRVDCTFQISAENTLEDVKDMMICVGKSCPFAIADKEVDVAIVESGSDTIKLQLKVWSNTDDYWQAREYMEESIQKKLRDGGFISRKSIKVSLDNIDELKGLK